MDMNGTKQEETLDQLRGRKTSTTYHSWWMNLMEPVQIQGWNSGFSEVPSDRQTRQMSTSHGNIDTNIDTNGD